VEKIGKGKTFLFSLNKEMKFLHKYGFEIECHPEFSLIFGAGFDIKLDNSWNMYCKEFSFLPENADRDFKCEIAPRESKAIEVEVFSVKKK